MLTFPALRTGSAVQYPLSISESFATEVLQFMAGDEQRYLTTANSLRSWQIRLANLDEAEMQSLEAFFVATSGSFESFSFTDPASAISYPNCFIDRDELQQLYSGELRGNLNLIIRQGRS